LPPHVDVHQVNDNMKLDHGPGFSLDEGLLATSLKALTTDQFLAKLMAPTAACEPIYMNHTARTALLTAMPMLDYVDITEWRFPGPTSPAAWAVLPAVMAALSLVGEAAAHQAVVQHVAGWHPDRWPKRWPSRWPGQRCHSQFWPSSGPRQGQGKIGAGRPR
jgi:hypothetical protein